MSGWRLPRGIYVFRNVPGVLVETVVAFPPPDIDLALGPTASNFDFQVKGDTYPGFTVSAGCHQLTWPLMLAAPA